MPDSLFIYGTLAPGRLNAHVLADVPGQWRTATVHGHLVQSGWAAELGFPALVLDPDAAPVAGVLFTSEDLPGLWPKLDDFEGEGYERRPVLATTQEGDVVRAQVYVAGPTSQ